MKTQVEALVNLNTNPCKMCMPMGASTAFYGISGCMTILHGSQGCATYIRRHMATHYNEPVDIASSSLTEEGTVYGGEKNLKQGLCNLITLYHPKVIGVMTTCLAETIGEDIVGIIARFYEEYPQYQDIEVIQVHSPGYGGTQYEGYLAAVHAIVTQVKMDTEKNDYVNVIVPPMSPADVRFLKTVFREYGIKAILVPDISENLDGGHFEDYERLPQNGTSIEDVRKMGGARFTIELTDVNDKNESANSPAKALYEKYGVPYQQLNTPVGITATDAFYHLIEELSQMGESKKEVCQRVRKERARYLDGIIDSHKYNSSGRAAVFGEPEFVIAAVRLCVENGIMPVVVATGSVFGDLKKYVEESIQGLAEHYFIEKFEIMDDADFKDIEEAAKRMHANILIGNSDGRRIEETLHIPLIRRAFPIHDRIGGQRLRMLGYEGSLMLLDEITNGLLEITETTYRETVYDAYYKDSLIDTEGDVKMEPVIGEPVVAEPVAAEPVMAEISLAVDDNEPQMSEEMKRKTLEHPCYNCAGHAFARMHLPVAPSCNVQCNYCVRKFDCPNESRPGVTSSILTPQEALERYQQVKAKLPNLKVVGIAGPGDALAGNYPQVKETLKLIREYDSDVTFCLSTNGLMLPSYAEELIALGVTHVTVTMSAVDPKISAQIYHHIEYMGTVYEGEAAGAIMVSNQMSGLRILIAHGIICKVNIVTLRGINEDHIPQVVQTCKDMGCYITNIMQLIPVKGSNFEHLPMVSNHDIQKIRTSCDKIMKQMFHCKQCRADAIGTLDNDLSVDLGGFLAEETSQPKQEQKHENEELVFAVASKSGINVDQHFGHVQDFYLYEYRDGEVRYRGKRNVEKYCNGEENCGEEEDKIQKMIITLKDCDGVIAMRIGEEPKRKLEENGIHTFTTFNRIEAAVREAAAKELPNHKQQSVKQTVTNM